MKAGQRCTFRINRVGRRYGELKVIADIGNRVYTYPYGKRTTPLLKLGCKRGHTEERCAVSLEATGDNTQCKQCRKTHGKRKKSKHTRTSTSKRATYQSENQVVQT